LRSQTAIVEDVHAGVFLDGEYQPLALLNVESSGAFYFDPGQEWSPF
jgi:hypothetical protein